MGETKSPWNTYGESKIFDLQCELEAIKTLHNDVETKMKSIDFILKRIEKLLGESVDEDK